MYTRTIVAVDFPSGYDHSPAPSPVDSPSASYPLADPEPPAHDASLTTSAAPDATAASFLDADHAAALDEPTTPALDEPTITPATPGRPPRQLPRVLLAYLLGLLTGISLLPTLRAAQPVNVSPAVAAISPAVIDLTASSSANPNGYVAGTGVVLNSTGIAVTNNHVIAGSTNVMAYDLGNGRHYRVTVLGYDRFHDVAVLQLVGAEDLATAVIGTGPVQLGQGVVALGNASGAGTPRIAPGHVVALNQSIRASDSAVASVENLNGLIQTNADIVPGDSGGPLVNAAGQLIAINVAAAPTNTAPPSRHIAPVGYSIPYSTVAAVVDTVLSGRSSGTVHVGPGAALGVVALSVSPAHAPHGATVESVIPGHPAALAGIAPGDTIIALGGVSVADTASLIAALSDYYPGDHVTVAWVDSRGDGHHATVELAPGPPQ